MAGSWTELSYRKGSLNGAYSRPVGVIKEFVADASDGSIPEVTVPGITGLLTGLDVEFGGTAPDTLTVAIKTIGGITLITSSALTASGRVEVDPPIDICGGYKILATGNTTNSASASIVCLFR